MIAEDWLKLNVKREDTSLDEMKDFIWTSNVIEYMEEYAKYKNQFFLDKGHEIGWKGGYMEGYSDGKNEKVPRP